MFFSLSGFYASIGMRGDGHRPQQDHCDACHKPLDPEGRWVMTADGLYHIGCEPDPRADEWRDDGREKEATE